MADGQVTFFKLSELLTEAERHNLSELLLNSDKRSSRLDLRHIEDEL